MQVHLRVQSSWTFSSVENQPLRNVVLKLLGYAMIQWTHTWSYKTKPYLKAPCIPQAWLHHLFLNNLHLSQRFGKYYRQISECAYTHNYQIFILSSAHTVCVKAYNNTPGTSGTNPFHCYAVSLKPAFPMMLSHDHTSTHMCDVSEWIPANNHPLENRQVKEATNFPFKQYFLAWGTHN